MTAGDLAREKLARLQEAWVLETDAARKFRLEKEIEETKAQVREFGGDLGVASMAAEKQYTTDKSISLENSQAGILTTGGNTVIHINPQPNPQQSQKSKLLWFLGGGGILIVIGLVIFFMSGGKTNDINTQVSSGVASPNIKNNSGDITINYTANPNTTTKP